MYFPGICEALGSIPNTEKQNKTTSKETKSQVYKRQQNVSVSKDAEKRKLCALPAAISGKQYWGSSRTEENSRRCSIILKETSTVHCKVFNVETPQKCPLTDQEQKVVHTPWRTPPSPTTWTNLEKMKTNPGNYYLTLNIYRQVMERGWGSGNRRRAAPMGSPKHAQSRITDVPVFAAVAAAESSTLDTKHLVQRWTVNLLSSWTWCRDGWQKRRCWFPGSSSSENSVRCKYWMLFYSSVAQQELYASHVL